MKLNQSGNTLVMVLVASTLILGAVVISMQYIGLTNRTSITALKNSLAGNDDLLALNILAGKVYLKNGTEWGVEPYPIATEFLNINFKPYIKNFSTATSSLVPNIRVEGKKNITGSCELFPVPKDIRDAKYIVRPEDCKLTNFNLDDSKLGSLESEGDILGWNADPSKRLQTELQKGFVGYPNLSQLSPSERDSFFKTQTALLPEGGINAKAVTFYKIASDPNEPRILSQLEVEVGKTRAIIPINSPPEPTCKITTKIDDRYIDCHQEPTLTHRWGVVGYHSEWRGNVTTQPVTTSTPRTSILTYRCSMYPSTSLYLPLQPRPFNCVGYNYNHGSITFYPNSTIYHINLGPRPGYFDYRGMIYSTDPNREILGADELTGMYTISFEQLLSELGVSSVIYETKQETVDNRYQVRVDDYGSIPVHGTKTVCNTRETPECNGDCIEISGGRGVTVNLFADSLLGNAQVSGDFFRTFQNFSTDKRQSIKTIREFTSEFPNETPIREPWGSQLIKPPHDLYLVQGARLWVNPDGTFDDEHGAWSVSGRVAGLKRASSNSACGTNFKVFPPPPPNCVASVQNPKILKGESTIVTLDCNQANSGRVTGAEFLNGGGSFDVSSFKPGQRGTSNYKIARASYTRRNDYLTESINIRVIGLGGEIIVTTYLGEVCKHNYPLTITHIQKENFPWAPLSRSSRVIDYNNGFWYAESAGHWNIINYDIETGNKDSARICNSDSFCMSSFQLTRTSANGTRDPNGQLYPAIAPGFYTMNKGVCYWAEIGPKRSPTCSITQYALRRRGCFTGETRIKMADGQEKLVSKISENDLIWNPLYQSPVKVIKVVKGPEKKALYQLRVAKNRLTVTEDHPFLTQRGWMRADQLNTQDLIMGEGLGKEILSIKKLSYKKPIDVYNFELETDIPEGHIVIANGIPTGDLTTQIEIKQNDKKLP